MTTTRVETLPATWDDGRDLPFFRLTSRLFSADFCLGAGVLLASYDDDTSAPTPVSTDMTTASVDTRTEADRAPVPVRVRRTR